MTRAMFAVLCLLAFVNGAFGQPPPIPGYDPSAIAENVKKFSEVYGLATQIMNMGGKFLGGSGGGGTGSQGLTSSANLNHNGILGEVVRPQFRGVGGNEYGENSLFENRPTSSSFSEYGGGPLGSSSGRPAQRQSAIASIMNTFLGSSLGSSGGSSGYEPYSGASSSGGGGLFSSALGGSGFGGAPSGYGSSSPSSSSGSDINEILAQLMRSGAKPAQPEPAGPASFISQLFGR